TAVTTSNRTTPHILLRRDHALTVGGRPGGCAPRQGPSPAHAKGPAPGRAFRSRRHCWVSVGWGLIESIGVSPCVVGSGGRGAWPAVVTMACSPPPVAPGSGVSGPFW